jgi:Flp pilus assembly protein TadG
MTMLRRLAGNDRAASAAEFALVLPLLLLFLFGIIDAGRFMWEYNQAEKATQMGVRYAVVTDPILSGLDTYSFAVAGEVQPGDRVTTDFFNSASCTNTSCSCSSTAGGFCGATSLNSTAFTNLVTRMSKMYAAIAANNVTVDYKNVGLGFSGDPNGPDVSALVTVKLRNLTFHPITCVIFACTITMPDFSAALTLEDGSNNGTNPPRAN